MPYISTKTNVAISKEKEAVLKTKLGEAITALGKTESWLMLSFEDNARLWFAGKEAPMAYLEVKLLGAAGAAAYEKMTARLTDIVSCELGIDPSLVYVKYEEVKYWGWNGGNF